MGLLNTQISLTGTALKAAQEINRKRTRIPYYSTRSNVFQHAIDNYLFTNNNTTRLSNLIATMLGWVTGRTITLQHNLLTFEANTFNNVKTIEDLTPLIDKGGYFPGGSQHTDIQIHYVPRGTSFLRNTINTEYHDNSAAHADALTHLTVEEKHLRVNFGHTLYIIKDTRSHISALHILTSSLDEKFLTNLVLALPLMLDVKPDIYEEEIITPTPFFTPSPKMNKETLDVFFKLMTYLFSIRNDVRERTETTAEQHTHITNLITDFFEKTKQGLVQHTPFFENYKNIITRDRTGEITEKITQTNERIKHYYAEITRLTNEIQEHNKNLIVERYVPKETPGIDEVLRLLENNSKHYEIIHINSSGTEIHLRVTAPLKYFDSVAFKTFTNPNSRALENFSEPYKRLLCKIFIERTYQLYSQIIFKFAIDRSSQNTPIYLNGTSSDAAKYSTLGNPHIIRANCLGKYEHEINKYLRNGQIDLAFTTCLTSAQSVNVLEALFLNYFKPGTRDSNNVFSEYWRNKWKIINPKGETITFDTAIKEMEAEIENTTAAPTSETPTIDTSAIE